MTPIEKKRQAFRQQYSTMFFNAYLNVFLVSFVLLSGVIVSGLNIHWGTRAIILLPLVFIYAEAVNYLVHRYQQHHEIPSQKMAFRMHTYWHHGMFSSERMSVDSFDDMNMVVLPFFVHGFVLGAVYLPIALLIDWFFQTDVGWIVMFGVATQLMWYEVVHTVSHLNNPFVFKSLARHHKQHHNRSLMSTCNFGIGITLFDHVFGTHFERKS